MGAPGNKSTVTLKYNTATSQKDKLELFLSLSLSLSFVITTNVVVIILRGGMLHRTLKVRKSLFND